MSQPYEVLSKEDAIVLAKWLQYRILEIHRYYDFNLDKFKKWERGF